MIVEKANIYLITYPNGKIYIGQDRTCDINYFGSGNGTLIEKDFNKREAADFTIRKQILKSFKMIDLSELNRIERELILKYKSNDPEIGYNRYPGMPKLPRKTQNLICNENS